MGSLWIEEKKYERIFEKVHWNSLFAKILPRTRAIIRRKANIERFRKDHKLELERVVDGICARLKCFEYKEAGCSIALLIRKVP